MLGYLFVRGGVHALAYAKALESLTGVDMKKMLPIPNIGNATFPEARRFMEQEIHLKLYRFSPQDYREAGIIWKGPAPAAYTEGFGDNNQSSSWTLRRRAATSRTWPASRRCFAPNYAPEEIMDIAAKLYKKSKNL